jgi:Aldo/keto reductase family
VEQAVERGLKDRFGVTSIAVDHGDGDDHVEDLFEREIVADLAGTLYGGEEGPAGDYHLGAVVFEQRVAAVRLFEQLGSDVALVSREGGSPVQPRHESCASPPAVAGLRGRAEGIDLVVEEGLEEFLASGEVAVKGRHSDAGEPRYLGHRHLGVRIGERGAGGSTGRWTPGSTSSTPLTATPPVSRKRSWARRWTVDGVRAWCSRSSLASPLETTTLTIAELRRDGSRRRLKRRWRRLRTDWIDLYQVGVPDPSTDIDETLGALTDLVHSGKIRYIGASKVTASQVVEAQWTAERRGHGRFRTEQPPYSLLTRAIEYDMLPTCLRHGMGVMAYSPLAGRRLSGKYRKGGEIGGSGSVARQRHSPADYDAANPANAAKLERRRCPRGAR